MSNVGWLVTQKFATLVPDPNRLRAVVGAVRLHTSSWPPFAGLFLIPRNKDDMCDGRTTTATVLTATAATTLALRVCLRFSSQPKSQDDEGGYLHNVYFAEQVDTGKACVTCQDTICQDLLRKATLPGQARRPCLSEEWRHAHHLCTESCVID